MLKWRSKPIYNIREWAVCTYICKIKTGKYDTISCRIGDFVELSLDILRTAVMFSEIRKIKNNLKCIKFQFIFQGAVENKDLWLIILIYSTPVMQVSVNMFFLILNPLPLMSPVWPSKIWNHWFCLVRTILHCDKRCHSQILLLPFEGLK